MINVIGDDATDPAGYYAAKERLARELAAKLEQRRAEGAPAAELRTIEHQLEAARYVGD